MGKNKQQAATEARTRKATPEVAEPAVAVEQPKPNGKADAKTIAAATPTKQDATIEKLKAGWTAKGINLDKLTIKDDGKFKLLIVDAGWPTVRIGASGGVTVMELKSYPDAFTAAMEGLDRYTKQQAREAKQAAAAAPPAVAKSAPPVAAPEVKTKAAA
jgi:multimeric flavodoxin WrbA